MIELARAPAIAVVVSAIVLGSALVPIPMSGVAPRSEGSVRFSTLGSNVPTGRAGSPSAVGNRAKGTPMVAGLRGAGIASEVVDDRSAAPAPSDSNYVPVTFLQTGLVLGTRWDVVVTDVGTVYSNGTSATLSLVPGEYDWSPGSVQGYGSSGGGNFSVVAAALWITVRYHGSLFTTYPVTFRAPEMPPGVPWYVNLRSGPSASSTNSTLTFYETNGSFGWSIGPTVHLTATPDSGVLLVNGTPLTETIDWLLASGYYEVLFNETGLPGGFNWSVTLNGTTTTTFASPIGFIVPNGSYPFTDESPSGFEAHPANGTATVTGEDTEFLIVFGPEIVPTYSIFFVGEFLPPHGTWSVTLAGLTLIANGPNVGMQFIVPNGSYPYRVRPPFGYMSTPTNGTVTVNGSNAPTVVLTFALAPVPEYEVTFLETGLPNGTFWDVIWAGATYYESENRTIDFGASNGTYVWVVSSESPDMPSPPSGELNVSGPIAGPLSIRFVAPPLRFPVHFVETGLPNGTLWSVTITPGASYTSLNATIEFTEPNGTFLFRVSNVSGLNSTPWQGTFSVAGGPLEIPVRWSPVSTSFLGSANFWLLVTLASATAIAAVVLVWQYRRPRLPFSRRDARRLLQKEFRH